MENIFNQIAIVSLVTIVGYIAGKTGIINNEIRAGLTRIVLLIAVPSSIISTGNLTVGEKDWMNVFYVLIIALVYHIVLLLFMKNIGRRWFPTDERGRVGTLCATFGNVMFMGYPIVTALYGQGGLFLASIYTVIFNLFIYTVGSNTLAGNKKLSLKELLLTPFNISIVIMFVLLITQFKLPFAIQSSLTLLGSLATPLSLITVGAMIAVADPKKIFTDPSVYLNTFLRNLAAPLLTLAVMYFLPLDLILRKTMVVLAAMPAAASNAMLAEQYRCDPDFASLSVVQSAIVFAVTFPVVMYLTNLLLV